MWKWGELNLKLGGRGLREIIIDRFTHPLGGGTYVRH